MLVFFSAAAGTGIVAAYFGTESDRFRFGHGFGRFTHHVAWFRSVPGRSGGRSVRVHALVLGDLGNVPQELLESHHAGSAAEDIVANLGLDADHQLFKNFERFRLVFDERIALSIRAQANGVAQAVHAVEMFLPEPVDGAENRVTFHRLERFGVFKTDFDFVGLANAV